MFKFITRRPFWLNLLVAILLTVGLLFGALKMLGVITKHGVILTVPTVVNTNTAAAIKLLESKGFEVVIQDSVYTDTAKLGTVLKQFPDGNSTVKINRLVLLTVNRVTLPNIDAPNLISKSQDYAIEIITRSHFTLGDTTFEPSYMKDAVIAQNYNGAKLEPGTKIPYGSKIDIVIGAGLSDRQFQVPILTGLTFAQAKQVLLDNRLLLASANPCDLSEVIKDTANAFVCKQIPPRENEDRSINYIREGQVVDLFLSRENRIVVDSSTLQTLESVDETAYAAMQKEAEDRAKAKEENDKIEKKERDKMLKLMPKALRQKAATISKPRAIAPTKHVIVKPKPAVVKPAAPVVKPKLQVAKPKVAVPKPKIAASKQTPKKAIAGKSNTKNK